MHQDVEILDWLIRNKKLTRPKAQAFVPEGGESAEVKLVQHGVLTRAQLLQIKAEINEMKAADLNPDRVDLDVVRIIPATMSRKFAAVAVGESEGRLVVALTNPADPFAQYYLAMRTNRDIEPRVAYYGDVLAIQQRAYGDEEPAVISTLGHAAGGIQPGPGALAAPATHAQPRRIQLPGDGAADSGEQPATPATRRRTMTVPHVTREEERLDLMVHVAASISHATDLTGTVTEIVHAARNLTGSDAVAFLLCEPERRYISYHAVEGRHQHATQFAVPFDETTLPGWCVLHNEVVEVPSLEHDDRFSTNAEAAAGLPTGGTCALPVVWGTEVLGALVASNLSDRTPDVRHLAILAAPLAAAVRTWRMESSIHNIAMEIVETLLDFHDMVSPGARQHGALVAQLATNMARWLPLSARDIELLCFAALLHDTGLVEKRDREDPAHPQLAGQLLQKIGILQKAIPIVRYHHERWDGGGYPHGLKGETIPLPARVLAVAEAYVERGLHRVERTDPALQTFLDEFGTAFDPSLKAAFIRSVNMLED